jgi:hypothetical protein
MRELNKKIAHIPIPDRLRGFPISDEGYPIPWFVPFVDGQPEFRAMDPEKFTSAVRHKKCWMCGAPLGKWLTFPIGPMCCVTRTTAEPPSHLACAQYAAEVCPFLTQPRMRRNEFDLPDGTSVAGIGIKRNPGVIALWTTNSFKLFSSNGGYLFKVGDPEHVECYAQGRAATKAELIESIRTGYPILEAIAKQDGGLAELEEVFARSLKVLQIRPEEMFIADRGGSDEDNRSGDGGVTGGKNVGQASANSLGASNLAPAQPLGGAPVRDQQGGGGAGHPVQTGPDGEDSRTLAQPGGRRDGVLAEGLRRVSVGSQHLVDRAMAVVRAVHRTD